MSNKFKGEYSGTKEVSERHKIDKEKLQKYLEQSIDDFSKISFIIVKSYIIISLIHHLLFLLYLP